MSEELEDEVEVLKRYAEELEKRIDRLETEIWLRDKYPHEWWEHLVDHEDIQEEE